MKSYTDLPQSKKLAEFLPIESADMYYCYGMNIHTKGWSFDDTPTIIDNSNQIDVHADIPCWSLAALISVLPRFIEYKGNKYYLRFMKEYVEYANDEFSITGRCLHTTGNDNLVDACYEMLLELHEQKLL